MNGPEGRIVISLVLTVLSSKLDKEMGLIVALIEWEIFAAEAVGVV